MSSNRVRAEKALKLLQDGLAPFIDREINSQDIKERKPKSVLALKSDPVLKNKKIMNLKIEGLLKIMEDTWNEVFQSTLGVAEQNCIFEIKRFLNESVNQEKFSSDDTYRLLDCASRLLTSISETQAQEIEQLKLNHLRVKYEQQTRNKMKKSESEVVQASAGSGLIPWREVIAPHTDVANGKFKQAQFAADLWQVHIGEGESEYRQPQEFFNRTFLTSSISQLLVNAVKQITSNEGDPVVQLQTNFGGGKTHSMLALYHLFSGVKIQELQGIEDILDSVPKQDLPSVKRVVLVGNKISPGNPIKKEDNTLVNTLWGELAWQLGGKEAFEKIQKDDENATNPGDSLRELLNLYGPSLILIDEWVAYARQLHDKSDLPAGDFETHFSFAQALTESVKSAKNCLLVVSLPASDTSSKTNIPAEDVEVGGKRGREALDRLRNIIGRVDSAWRPATPDEGFEIVRRRLFEPLTEQTQFLSRDNVAKSYSEFYRKHKQEFPAECGEFDYENRIKSAYPIHPEIFDRLYNDWSSLLTFQRTRGVLRLMASVIHYLWENEDKSPLIQPANIPISNETVQFELTRYLSDPWVPIIEKDVDGQNSLPRKIDTRREFGKLAACRKVARTIYLGSAPNASVNNPGIEDKSIYLGCVVPSEPPATFGDALRQLSSEATYLYQDNKKYWYSTKPTVTKLAEERSERFKSNTERLRKELKDRIENDIAKKGDFSKVHTFPKSSHDIADQNSVSLVILGMDSTYIREQISPAQIEAQNILEFRGSNARKYKNMLVFLAPDQTLLPELEKAISKLLAWESINTDKNELNLTQQQLKQVDSQISDSEASVNILIPEVFQWLLIPKKGIMDSEIKWEKLKISGNGPLAECVSKKLIRDEKLLTSLAGTRLRLELDQIPLWKGDNVSISELRENFAEFLYLPRIKDQSVLINAINDGLGLLNWEAETFAYADAFDSATSKYQGLRCGENYFISDENSTGLIVKPDIASKQQQVIKTVEDSSATPNDDENKYFSIY